MDEMNTENVDNYVQKAYDENDIAVFAILTSYMTEEELETWMSKAQNDKKITFFTVLSEEAF